LPASVSVIFRLIRSKSFTFRESSRSLIWMLTEGWDRCIFFAVFVMLKVFAAILKMLTW
jgi:hypothetical protein